MMNSIHLQRNCSATPGLVMSVLGSMIGISLVIGLAFWAMGAPWILAFAGLEIAALLVAFFFHARSVNDKDLISFDGCTLLVRRERQGRIQEYRFHLGMVRVNWSPGLDPLVRLSEGGRHIDLGHWLNAVQRRALHQQLQQMFQTKHGLFTDPFYGLSEQVKTVAASSPISHSSVL